MCDFIGRVNSLIYSFGYSTSWVLTLLLYGGDVKKREAF